jgi:hypothetical protein
MPGRFRFLSACVIAVVISSEATSQVDPPGKDLPFAGPSPPEELQVLAQLIGQWDVTLEWRPSLQDQKGKTAKGRLTGEWLHNRHFIRLESQTASSKYRGESTTLYAYDTKKKAYRRWLFTSDGLTTEAEGQWDAGNRTMTWKPLNVAPNVTGSITDRVTKDRIEAAVLFRRNDGQTVVDVTMTATRKR